MKLDRAMRWFFVGLVLAIVVILAFTGEARADNPRNRPPDNRPPDHGTQTEIETTAQASSQAEVQVESASESTSAATATTGDSTATANGGHGGDGGAASATNEGVTVGGDRVENNSSNVVLVPNNNTANCMRVYGLSFGRDGTAGALGVPFRDKSCDFEQAADDAAAMGQHKIAWWWRCHKPVLYKTFSGDSKEMRQLACWNSMVKMLEGEPQAREEESSSSILGLEFIAPSAGIVNDGYIRLAADEYEELQLMAQSAEEVEEHFEQSEYRYAQQQNLLKAQEQEIEQLKKEAARVKQREAEEAMRRQKVLRQLAENKDAT